MTKKRMNSAIANANGGIESVRALKQARTILLNHDLKQPVLYHLVFTGSQSIPVYQAVRKSLMRRLRSRCRLEYFGAFENDDEKGLHAHCYILIETSKKTPFDLLHVGGKYLSKLANDHALNPIHISKPKNAMHGRNFFARPIPGPLLDNVLDWIEYPFKRRSKDGIPVREKYFFSEFKANKTKRATEMQQYYAPAAPAANTETTEGNYEERTETKPAALPIGCLSAEQEGADSSASTSRESLVDAGQCTSASEEGSGREASRPSPEHVIGSEDEENHCGAIEMKALTTAEKYVGLLYERAVDQGLDVDEVRRYLFEHGVLRTPGQVAWELEHVYEFHQYVATHQPKPVMSVRDYDRAIGHA